MIEKDKKKVPVFWLCSIMVPVTVLLTAVCGRMKGLDSENLLQILVMSGIGSFLAAFLWLSGSEQNEIPLHNSTHAFRFVLIYVISLILALTCIFLPSAGWPFLVIYITLSLFSSQITGICTGSFLLMLTVLLGGTDLRIFALYFVTGIAGICMFRHLDENYRIGIPLFVSLMFLLVGETAGVVLFRKEAFKAEMFLIPLLNVIISLVLLLIILKLYSMLIIFRYQEKYMEINDQEYELLVRLKEKDKETYYKALHTGYFCERIAKAFSLDDKAAKCAGYYKNIGILYENNDWDSLGEVLKSYQFPPYACLLLKELWDGHTPVRHKETAIVMMSESVISFIFYLFAQDKDCEIDYPSVVEAVFQKKLDAGILKECELTMKEWNCMKKIFKEEKLYYDFLR